MKNGRGVMSRGPTKGKGNGKEAFIKPGFLSGGGHPKEWPARTGYTSESRLGASSHGTNISLPKKG